MDRDEWNVLMVRKHERTPEKTRKLVDAFATKNGREQGLRGTKKGDEFVLAAL